MRVPSLLLPSLVLILASSAASAKEERNKGYVQLCVPDPSMPRNHFEIETNMTNTSTDEPLYWCNCPHPDYEDVRTTESFCPLGFACGIPPDEIGSVDCITRGSPWNGVVRMAWPILFITAGLLVIILVMSSYGLALSQYFRITYYQWKEGKEIAMETTTNSTEDGSSLKTWQRLQQDEVDEFMELAASMLREEESPEPPSRCRVREFQRYLYQQSILQELPALWRREWRLYETEVAKRPPPPLILPVQKFAPDANQDMNEVGWEEHEDDDTSLGANKTTCSICFASLPRGERIGALKCRHIFHASCLKMWLSTGRNNRCPLCQAPNIAHYDTTFRGDCIGSKSQDSVSTPPLTATASSTESDVSSSFAPNVGDLESSMSTTPPSSSASSPHSS